MGITNTITGSYIGTNNVTNTDNSTTIRHRRNNCDNDYRSDYKNRGNTKVNGAHNNLGTGQGTPPSPMGPWPPMPHMHPQMANLMAQFFPPPQSQQPFPFAPPPPVFPPAPAARWANSPPPPVVPPMNFNPTEGPNAKSYEYPASPPPTVVSEPGAVLSPLSGVEELSALRPDRSRSSNNPFWNGTYERIRNGSSQGSASPSSPVGHP